MSTDNNKTDLDVINEWLDELKATMGATTTIPNSVTETVASMVVCCKTCKHCEKIITEDPCFSCDPRKGSIRNYWEKRDDEGN